MPLNLLLLIGPVNAKLGAGSGQPNAHVGGNHSPEAPPRANSQHFVDFSAGGH
jgi:hypothetical protein